MRADQAVLGMAEAVRLREQCILLEQTFVPSRGSRHYTVLISTLDSYAYAPTMPEGTFGSTIEWTYLIERI